MRIAIIGTGFIATIHVQTLQRMGDEVVVAVNHTLAKAEAFAQKWGIPKFGIDYSLALSPEIDVVHICTPPSSHYQLIKAALLSDKHVICEKPMCIDPLEAKELVQLAAERQKIGAVLFNVRFHEACHRARSLIATPDFGAIRLIHGSYLQEFHALPDTYSWRYKSEVAGPMRATTEIGSHWVDLVRYWTGLEIAAVSAQFANFNPQRHLSGQNMYAEKQEGNDPVDVDSEDVASISFRFTNGAIGNVLLSEVSHGRSNRLHLEVSGSKQSIWWTNEHPYQLHHAKKFKGVTTATYAFGGGFSDTFQACFEEIYQDIENGKTSAMPAYATFYDGYVNAAVCMAIYESAKNDSRWTKIYI